MKTILFLFYWFVSQSYSVPVHKFTDDIRFLIFLQWNPNPELKVSCSASLQSQPSCTILWELCVKLKPWLETITFLRFILNWIYPKYLPQRNNYFFLLTINIIEFSITYNDNLIKRSTEVNLLRTVSKATLWQNQFWWIKIKFSDFFETETEFIFNSQGYIDPFLMIFLWEKEQDLIINLQQWR